MKFFLEILKIIGRFGLLDATLELETMTNLRSHMINFDNYVSNMKEEMNSRYKKQSGRHHIHVDSVRTPLLTYLHNYLLTYLLTYLLHAAESFLRS